MNSCMTLARCSLTYRATSHCPARPLKLRHRQPLLPRARRRLLPQRRQRWPLRPHPCPPKEQDLVPGPPLLPQPQGLLGTPLTNTVVQRLVPVELRMKFLAAEVVVVYGLLLGIGMLKAVVQCDAKKVEAVLVV